MSDILRMDYINSLPQPFLLKQHDGWKWPVHDIAVDAGLLRVDVCGLLQVMSMADASAIIDASGVEHDPDTFYSDYEEPTP